MTTRRARLLAFYLPQFHPIPENDLWWGPGFTEWTNVAQARPAFTGHYQPHLPGELGFYDLRLPEARIAQAALAAAHGIEGFCYWHYWFNGRRLLERPFDEVLASSEPDFPVCLAWANESWSRRWMGDDKDVLIPQEYSLADDIEHARWLAHAFADPRYVRIGGRPLFLVYRPRDLPSPRRTTDTIRREVVRAGDAEPLLLGVTSFHHQDFRAVGFDGTVAFEPAFAALPRAGDDGGQRYDYTEARRAMRDRSVDFPTHPCIMVGWDNTPRRGTDAIVLTDSTPERFEDGLREIVDSVADRPLDERLVFVNAWNEWAEGNHLEPDARHGRRFLEAVDRVTREGSLPARAHPRLAPAPPPVRETAPLIVFGAPRSGTTYLQRVMDLHPAIYLSHETRVFAWLHAVVNVLPESDQFVVTERERFVAHLRATLPEVLRDFYEKLNPDTRYWGDKNPHYADPNNRGCLALTAELFPGTRFVNVVRDGRDVVASLMRRAHENGDPWVDFEAAHRTWITHVEIGTSFGSRQSPESYLEVRYEDFVRDDIVGAKELCAFLDLELPPAVEEFCAAQRQKRTPLSSPTRAAIGDLTSSDWSSVFSREEQIRSLELLGPHLVNLGYESEDSIRILRDALLPKPRAQSVAQPPVSPAYPRRLNWGCGECGEPGWINSDIKEGPGVDLSCDIRDGLAIESDSLDYVVSIHALPMISYDDLVPVLRELRRVLKPGGVLRLALPDVDKGIRAYLAADRSYFEVPDEDADSLSGKFIVHMLWFGYSVSMFTSEFTHELLRRAGFGLVRDCGYRETGSEHEGITELDNRERETFFVEAVKTA